MAVARLQKHELQSLTWRFEKVLFGLGKNPTRLPLLVDA